MAVAAGLAHALPGQAPRTYIPEVVSEIPVSPKVPAAGAKARSSPFKRRGHIVFVLLAALAVVALLPLVVISWKLIKINQVTLAAVHQDAQLKTARSIAREMDAQVEGLRTQLLRVAKTLSVAVGRQGRSNPGELRDVLQDVTDERMPALQFSQLDSGSVSSISAGQMPAEMKPQIDKLLSRAIEIHAEERHENWTLLSDPMLLESSPDHAALVVAAPVVLHGSFRGVLWAQIDLQVIWEAVGAQRNASYVVFALDGNGNVFASNDARSVSPGGNVRDSELVQRFLSAHGRASETMPFSLIEGGEPREYMGSFEETQKGWGIFVQAPREKVFQQIKGMRRETMKWAGIALALALGVGLVLARELSDPVKRLAAASRAFAKGDFSVRVAVRSRNELGELAFTFNSMAAEIEKFIRDLKQALAENNELFLGTIQALAQAIDAKDPYTRGHSDRVRKYAIILARQLGLSQEELREVHVSAQLHDVGKIGIHDAILQKPGSLTDEEFEVMKTHTTKGAEIMHQIPQMKKMIPGLRWHHERADGRGYPDGLTGDRIPLMAKIIAVADTFDAITTVRPYQQPMTFERARARINELRAVALDAEVVDAFNRACAEGVIRLAPRVETPAEENDVAQVAAEV
jgi:HD-GYP domain-containing protein (c-di-GMP phosphodiesterase class II)